MTMLAGRPLARPHHFSEIPSAGMEWIAVPKNTVRNQEHSATVTALMGALLAIALGGCIDSSSSERASPSPPVLIAEDPGVQPWNQVARDQVAAACGLDPALLDRVAAHFALTPYTIVRYGQLCWSGGYPGGTTTAYEVFSITKTLGAILFGIVASRSSLSDSDSVGEWIAQEELGDINPSATLAHILAMTSTKADLRYGMKGEWSYDAGGDREINVLVGVMNRAIAREPDAFPGVANVRELAERELFAPLGMKQTSWPGENIASTLVSTVEDMSRLGLLLLRKGRWDGKQLLDESFVYRMTHPAFEDTNTGYGYLTQMNAERGWSYSTGTADLECSPYSTWMSYPHAPLFESPDANGGSPFAPLYDIGLVWAAGALGQKISIHRGLDLVITVRDDILDVTGINIVAGEGLFEGHRRVWRLIRPALVALDPTYSGDEAGFCDAYRRSAYAPDLLSPWSVDASQ
jgi:CubicO group peptidase (beta-lactamase class C family)